MEANDEGITVNRNALVSALLEMERQYALEYSVLSRYLEHIEQACQGIHRLLESCRFARAKDEVMHCLFPQGGFSISETQLEQWRESFERQWREERRS